MKISAAASAPLRNPINARHKADTGQTKAGKAASEQVKADRVAQSKPKPNS